MTVPWDRGVDHEVLENLVGALQEEAAAGNRELLEVLLVGNPEDRQEAWGRGRGSHRGTVEEDHAEEWEVCLQEQQGRWVYQACLLCS